MPYLLIQTNQALPAEGREALLAKASKEVSDILGKPEQYVMVALQTGIPMRFAGSAAPCAYLELKSIGLPEARTAELSEALSHLVEEGLKVSPQRTYIEFADARRHMWGWNGATF